MRRVEVRHMVQVGRSRAGLRLPYPSSEHDVTDEQLAELRADFRLHVTEIQELQTGRQDASGAVTASDDPPKPGPAPGEPSPNDDLPKTPDERDEVKQGQQNPKRR